MGVLRNLCSLIYDIYVDMLKIGDSSQLLFDLGAVRTSFKSCTMSMLQKVLNWTPIRATMSMLQKVLNWTPMFKDTLQPSFPRT